MKSKKKHPFCESGHKEAIGHRTYVTPKFLMCGECHRPIRKLTGDDRSRLDYLTQPITEEESNAYGALLDKIK